MSIHPCYSGTTLNVHLSVVVCDMCTDEDNDNDDVDDQETAAEVRIMVHGSVRHLLHCTDTV